MQNEFLYHGHMVRALLRDGRIVEGRMALAAPGDVLQHIEIDGTAYGTEEVADILYLGRLADYSASSQTGRIDCYSFDGRDCPESAEFGSLIYREQEYRMGCHLEIRRNAIRAVDVRVLQKAHVLNEEILTAERAFYRFADGRWVMGLLEAPGGGLSLLTGRQERIRFSEWEVADITRIPAVNDIVTVRTADGGSVHGIVSAVEEDRMLVIAGLQPQMVHYRDLRELRYQGTVTEGWKIDSKYHYIPSFSSKDREEESICERASVSYVAGVDSRHWTAKDIRLVEEAGEAQKEAPLDQYGVILMVANVGLPRPEDYGYIGPEYRSKVCGPKGGNVRFQRKQIPFPYDYAKGIYVVRYSLCDTMDSGKYLQVERMELVEMVDYARFGIVRVDRAGRIKKVPMYRALSQRYENREVDVLRRGTVFSGVLIAQKEKGIWLKKEDTVEQIPYDEIESVRIRGKVTEYSRQGAQTGEGAGFIDRDVSFSYFSVDRLTRAMMRNGALVSYELCNFHKGDSRLCARNIDVEGGVLEGYALGYREGMLTVVPAEEYTSVRNPMTAARYSIDMEDRACFPALDRYDYRGTFTLRKKGDCWECTSVQAGEEIPKVMEGYATGLQEETIRIVPLWQYGTGGEGECFTLLNAKETHARRLNLERYDYVLRYRVRGQGAVEVVSVNEAKKKEKIFYGYIDRYYNAKQFGYIIPKEYYGKLTIEEQCEQGVGVWCRSNVFANAPEHMNTYLHTYYVKYTLRRDTGNAKPSAASVVFLESCAKSRKPAPLPAPKREAFTGEGLSENAPGLMEGETLSCRTAGGELRQAEPVYEEKPEQSEARAGEEPEQSEVRAGEEPEQSEVRAGEEPEQGEVHAGDGTEQSEAHAGDGTEQSEAHAGEEPEQGEVHAGDGTEQSEAHAGEEPEQGEAHAGEEPGQNESHAEEGSEQGSEDEELNLEQTDLAGSEDEDAE